MLHIRERGRVDYFPNAAAQKKKPVMNNVYF